MKRLLLLVLLTSACSFGRTMRASDASEAAPPPAAAPVPRNRAAVSLEKDARRYVKAGEHEKAVTTLERALRIAPGDPHLWLELARVRVAQEEWERAETLAAKAASLAGSDEALRDEAQALEKRARRRR